MDRFPKRLVLRLELVIEHTADGVVEKLEAIVEELIWPKVLVVPSVDRDVGLKMGTYNNDRAGMPEEIFLLSITAWSFIAFCIYARLFLL